MDQLFNNLYLPQAATAPKMNPSFPQLMESAFRMGNDAANLLDYMSRPTFEPDLEFDFQAEFTAQKLPIDVMPMLAGSLSKPEFDFNLGKLKKETQDKAILAAGGWGGTVAALGAGVLSPTVFLPFTGQARGGLAFAQVLGLAAVSAGAYNGALFLNQTTRTEAELYSGIAIDTLLMGTLGGAWVGLTGRARSELAESFLRNQENLDVPTGNFDVMPGQGAVVRNPELPELAPAKPYAPEDFQIEVAPGLKETSDGFTLLHGGRKGLTVADLQIVRTGQKQGKKGRVYGGFYTASGADEAYARGYAEMLEDGAVYRIEVTPGTRVLEKEGDITRLSAAQIDEWVKQDIGIIVGKDPRGKTEYVIIDKKTVRVIEQMDESRPPARLDEDTGMVRSPGEAPIQGSNTSDAQPVGAAVTKTRNTLGAKAAPNRARQVTMDTLGRLSPSYRMLTQRTFASLRNAIAKIDMSGIQQAGLATVEASAKEGTVISRILGYDANLVRFAIDLDKSYYKYIHGTDKGFDFNSPAVTQIKAYFGRLPSGKMKWLEYKEAVFDAQNTGVVPPELADAVKAYDSFFKEYTTRQAQYLKEFADQGLDVEPLFKVIEGDELGAGVEQYAHHIFSKEKLMSKMNEFLEDFTKYNENSLVEAFGRAQTKYKRKQAGLEYELAISKMDPETISARLDSVEGDLEFLEELPEMQNFREERLALTRQAREEGWPKEQLKAQLKDLQENLSPETKQLQLDRKGLMAEAKVLRKFGGDAAKQVAKLKAEIDKADSLIDAMFRDKMPAVLRADLSLGRVQQAGDTALSSVNKQLAGIVKTLQTRQAKMTKLLSSTRANTASRQKVAEQIEVQKVKYAEMLQRLESVNGQQVARDDQLRELHYVRESVVQDATALVRKRAAKLEDLEDRLEVAEAKPLTPEERARMGAQVSDDILRAESEFQMKWSERGEMSGDPTTTNSPDFKERAKDLATMLHQRLMNTEVELSPAYKAVRQGERGAELLRTLKIPYPIKSKYLEKDVELSTRAYDRVMGPDLELWRAFDGSVNAKSVLGEMQQEATEQLARISEAKFVRLPKGWTDKSAAFLDRVKKRITELGEADDIFIDAKNFSDAAGNGFVPLTPELRNQLSQSVHAAVKASTRDFDVAIQRLRATRTVPDNPDSLMWRGGKMVKQLNVTTMMGGVLVSSVSDIARPVWRHGIQKTFGAGWKPYLARLSDGAKDFRVRAKQVNQQIGLNLDPVLHGRAQAFFGVFDNVVAKTKLERGVEFTANKMGLIALYDYWTAAMKSVAGNVFHATMAEYVPAVAKQMREGGEFTGDALQMRTYLRNLGLSDNTIQRLAFQMEREGGMEIFSNGGKLPNMDAWDDPVAYQAYQAAAIKEVNELIVTPGLERPNWTDENMGYSMLAQFKSFTFSSTSRMAMSGLQGNDPYLMQGVAFSLALGAVSYYTYALTAGGKTLEKAQEMDAAGIAWEAVKRSGVLGAVSLVSDALEKVPAASGEQPTIFTSQSGLLGAFLGPTFGQANKLAGAITQINSDDVDQQARNLKALRQVFVPMQNHFLFRRLFDRAGESMIGVN